MRGVGRASPAGLDRAEEFAEPEGRAGTARAPARRGWPWRRTAVVEAAELEFRAVWRWLLLRPAVAEACVAKGLCRRGLRH